MRCCNIALVIRNDISNWCLLVASCCNSHDCLVLRSPLSWIVGPALPDTVCYTTTSYHHYPIMTQPVIVQWMVELGPWTRVEIIL